MTKTDAQLAELDRLVDRTATDAATGRQIKACARRVVIAAIQDLSASAARVRAKANTATPEGVERVKEALGTPSGVKIISYGANR